MKITKEPLKLENKERIFSNEELQSFHEELQNFKVFGVSKGETVSYIDFIKYHILKGTMSDRNTVKVQTGGFGDIITPTRYERLENKIRQYNQWLSRKEFVEDKKIENLQDLASGIDFSIKQDEIIADEIPF